MTVFLPGYKAYCPADLCLHTLHNIYPIRGAETRDAKAWAGYINEAIHKFGGKFDVVFLVHNWPIWGEERSLEFLKKQRDVYKYVHDQTLRLANAGYTIDEVGDKIKLPKSLSETWSVRGNYGTVSQNAKAVYNRYLGYYDANPSNLNPLPPEEAAVKFLEYFGGAKQVLEKAKVDFDKGEYRWVATVLRYVVFAEPNNQEARKLLADTYEQLGYASEAAPWRNSYLTGAQELLQIKDTVRNRNNNVLSVLSIGYLFDLLAVQLNGERADGKKLTVNFEFTDISEKYTLYLENSVINYWKDKCEENADAAVIITKQSFLRVFSGEAAPDKLLLSGEVKVTGNPLKLAELFGLLDKPDNSFNIILP
jgi:alkyl sulfatase BDS1-like metallo-beta-lactamase superfamily hydrolase